MKGLVEGAKPLFPFFASGPVVRGFGRGSKQLGCPTANFPNYVVDRLPLSFPCGVYYGWASVNNGVVHKMVMSVGTNPHFHNNVKTMETHILHKFDSDFYGQLLKVIIVGFIRDMESFKSLDDLIAAIDRDIQQATVELEKRENFAFRSHLFFDRGGEKELIGGNSQVFNQMRQDLDLTDPEDKSLQ